MLLFFTLLLYHHQVYIFLTTLTYEKGISMKHSCVAFVCSGFLLLLLPSCGRIVDWGKRTLYQGEELIIDYSKAHNYIRSVNAYDQFTTIARFDALWLSEEVRNIYATIYTQLAERNDEQKKILLQRQLDETAHFIIFYVLVPHDVPFNDTNALWSIFLSVDSAFYDPIEVKTIELSPIYKAFFGERYNRFRVAYQLKFDARDINNNQLITTNTQLIQLHFRSLQKALILTWNLPELKELQELQIVCSQLEGEPITLVPEKDSSVPSVGDL